MIDDYYDAESAMISHTDLKSWVGGGGHAKTLRTKLSDDRGKKTLQPWKEGSSCLTKPEGIK